MIRMHKLITGWDETDHINHDGLDNRRANLRPATSSQNKGNQRPRISGTSPYKGVSRAFKGKPWQVFVGHEYVGTFDDEVEAARAYDAAARERFGEFACPNFP